ncbi:Uncharacterised protein [Achromobacter xylosoxidans]|nr:Uncharacterised protein [Achromobacter xylosoxidans]
MSCSPSTAPGVEAWRMAFMVLAPKRTRVGCQLSAIPASINVCLARATASSSIMPGRMRAAMSSMAWRVLLRASSMPSTEKAGPTRSLGSE